MEAILNLFNFLNLLDDRAIHKNILYSVYGFNKNEIEALHKSPRVYLHKDSYYGVYSIDYLNKDTSSISLLFKQKIIKLSERVLMHVGVKYYVLKI